MFVFNLYQLLDEAIVAKLDLATKALRLDSTSFHYDERGTEDD